MGRGHNVVFQQTVHLVRCFGRIGFDRRVVAVVKNDGVILVGDIVVGVRLIEQTAVADILHCRRHFADGNAAFHAAERQRTDVGLVRFAEVLEAEVLGRLLICFIDADELHRLYGTGVGRP